MDLHKEQAVDQLYVGAIDQLHYGALKGIALEHFLVWRGEIK